MHTRKKGQKLETYRVYALVKERKCVYIGCSTNVPRRCKQHKVSKDFDGFIVLFSAACKEDAYFAERMIIRFLSVFDDGVILNAKHDYYAQLVNFRFPRNERMD
jgi:hypothetical protein